MVQGAGDGWSCATQHEVLFWGCCPVSVEWQAQSSQDKHRRLLQRKIPAHHPLTESVEDSFKSMIKVNPQRGSAGERGADFAL